MQLTLIEEISMKKPVFYFVASTALALSSSVFAQSELSKSEIIKESSPAFETRTQSAGRSRAEVLADLACAQASGELALLHSDVYDEIRAAAVREKAARTPACQ
jgi:hypothetical protein